MFPEIGYMVMQNVSDRYVPIARRDSDETLKWNVYDNQRKIVLGSYGDFDTKEQAMEVIKSMTQDPFDLVNSFVKGESDKGLDVEDSYARLCGALEGRLGLILNTLRAHRPEAYEFLINEYKWGEETS